MELEVSGLRGELEEEHSAGQRLEALLSAAELVSLGLPFRA